MPRSSAGSTSKRTASRELRSASPVKMPPPTSAPMTESPSRPKATPRSRKPKKPKATPASDSRAASAALAAVVDATPPSVADSEEEEVAAAETVANAVSSAIADAAVVEDNKENASPASHAARVTVISDVIDDDGVETTRTQVQVELPGEVPGEPIPETAEDALENAKQIVADAKIVQELQQQQQQTNGDATVATPSPSQPKSRKRKASEADLEIKSPEEEIVEEVLVNGDVDADGNVEIDGVTAKQEVISTDGEVSKVEFGARDGEPARKRTRVMVPADEFRRQKMQKRALMGLSATLAVGAMIPFVSSLF